jgi:hypothetical protein
MLVVVEPAQNGGSRSCQMSTQRASGLHSGVDPVGGRLDQVPADRFIEPGQVLVTRRGFRLGPQ